jgi:hypothetical protein
MNCHDVEQILHEQLDGTRSGVAEDVSAHLAECRRCRELHQAAQLLEQGLHALVPATPPAGLTGKIVTRVLAQRRRRLVLRYTWAAVAAAAALLIAVPLLGWLFPGDHSPSIATAPVDQDQKQEPEPAPEVKAPGPKVPPDQPKVEPAPSLKSSVAQAGQAVVNLTDRLADETRKQALMLWSVADQGMLAPMNSIPGTKEMDDPLDPAAAKSLQQATSGVTSGLQVVTGSARQAVTYFTKGFSPVTGKAKVQ